MKNLQKYLLFVVVAGLLFSQPAFAVIVGSPSPCGIVDEPGKLMIRLCGDANSAFDNQNRQTIFDSDFSLTHWNVDITVGESVGVFGGEQFGFFPVVQYVDTAPTSVDVDVDGNITTLATGQDGAFGDGNYLMVGVAQFDVITPNSPLDTRLVAGQAAISDNNGLGLSYNNFGIGARLNDYGPGQTVVITENHGLFDLTMTFVADGNGGVITTNGHDYVVELSVVTSTVPEPSSILLTIAALGIFCLRRKK